MAKNSKSKSKTTKINMTRFRDTIQKSSISYKAVLKIFPNDESFIKHFIKS